MPPTDTQTAPAFRPVRFVVVFAVVYALLHALYFAVPDPILRDVVHYRAVVAPAAALIRVVAPDEPVTAAAGTLRSPRAALDIVRGCDGAGVAFLLLAAVLAFPAGPARKLAGALGALAFAWLLNLLRVTGLYFAAAYRHEWFNLLHNFLVPTVVILLCCVMFAWWTAWSAGARSG
jgi:exosortase family protein XrtM